MGKKQAVLYLAAILLLCILPSCGQKQEVFPHNGGDDRIPLLVGETVTLELSHVPEGLTPDDYTWYWEGAGKVMDVRGGTATGSAPGDVLAWARAEVKNTQYIERFYLEVLPSISQITFTPDNAVRPFAGVLPMQPGQNIHLRADIGTDSWKGMTGEWASSDESIVHVQYYYGDDPTSALLLAKAPGTATISLTLSGVTGEMQVTVGDIENNLLSYIGCVAQYNASHTDGGAAYLLWDETIPNRGLTAGELSQLGTSPQGKYAVMGNGMLNRGETGADLGLWESEMLYCTEMTMLPPELIPRSLDEVESIIYAEFTETQVGTYEGGIKAMRIDVTVSLKNAATGEMLKEYGTVAGGAPPNKIPVEVARPPEKYPGSTPDPGLLIDRAIGELWAEQYDTVWRGSLSDADTLSVSAVTAAGDEVIYPLAFGLLPVWQANLNLGEHIRAVTVPANMHVYIAPGDYYSVTLDTIYVEEGSPAQQWCETNFLGDKLSLLPPSSSSEAPPQASGAAA